MNYDGKTYRNLEGQVKYLTEVAEALDERITEVAANIPSKMIVEELPEEGDPNITYYVGPKGTEPNLYYEVWVWVQEVEDGPFVWRELEDTDQVDLSGYLEKMTGTPNYPLVYVLLPNGNQGSIETNANIVANNIVRRTDTGQINVSTAPVNDNHATSKKYVDDNFLAKSTSTTSYDRIYGAYYNGTQTMFNVSEGANAYTIAMRDSAGKVLTKDPVNSSDAVNKSYGDSTYLAKLTSTSTYDQAYVKTSSGGQSLVNISNTNAEPLSLARRNPSGQIVVPGTPTENNHAASKAYVDASVGQLIYHHDMVIQYTLTGDADYVKIAAHSDNNTSTAFTSIDWHNMPLIMPDYAMYYHNSNDYLASVTKLPYGLHQDEFSEPRDGFLLTYWDGSALQNVRVNSSIFNTPTVTDVVTTW